MHDIPENMAPILSVVCSCEDEYFGVDDTKFLWHYTDLEAVHGMLSTETFWLGNARFMNDPKEISGSIDEIRKILKPILKKYDPAFLDSIGLGADGILQRNDLRPNSFLACFTSQADQLTHWLCYSKKEHGAAIKIRTKDLCEWVDEMGWVAKAIKVTYSQEEKKRIIESFIEQITEAIASDDYTKSEMHDIRDLIDVFFETCIISFKNDNWKHECEYRIHFRNENSSSKKSNKLHNLKHSFQGSVIRSHIECKFDPNKLIEEIILLKDDRLRSATLKEFLIANKMESIQVSVSKNEVQL